MGDAEAVSEENEFRIFCSRVASDNSEAAKQRYDSSITGRYSMNFLVSSARQSCWVWQRRQCRAGSVRSGLPIRHYTEEKPMRTEKHLSRAIHDRRATPSFDGRPIPFEDLRRILDAGLSAPSAYNLQPWRFIVVRSPEQKHRLRSACYNQPKVDEASAVIVACGDADGWRNGDLEEMLRMGRENGLPENYAEQAKVGIPAYLSNHPNIPMWLNRQVIIAFTHMVLI